MVPDNCDCDSAANYGGGSGAALQVSDMTQDIRAALEELLTNYQLACEEAIICISRETREKRIAAHNAILAALAAPPVQSEAVGYEFRTYYHDPDDEGWGGWFRCSKEEYERLKGDPTVEVRALYAAPADGQVEHQYWNDTPEAKAARVQVGIDPTPQADKLEVRVPKHCNSPTVRQIVQDCGFDQALAWGAVCAALEAYERNAQPAPGAVEEIAAERERQKSVEGWTTEHDDEHGELQLASAALSYVAHCVGYSWVINSFPDGAARYIASPTPEFWPWDEEWWKPKEPRRDLVRAGALIVAEIERMDRALRAKEK